MSVVIIHLALENLTCLCVYVCACVCVVWMQMCTRVYACVCLSVRQQIVVGLKMNVHLHLFITCNILVLMRTYTTTLQTSTSVGWNVQQVTNVPATTVATYATTQTEDTCVDVETVIHRLITTPVKVTYLMYIDETYQNYMYICHKHTICFS